MWRVVIIEDDEPLRSALTELLEANGHLVTALPDAELALEAIARVHPDVIVTDLHLPGMDGRTLLRALHRSDISVPAIMISGAFPDDDDQGSQPGDARIRIRKPFKGATLLEAIQQALEE